MRRVHAFVAEGRGRILNESDVVAKLHAKASGGFDTGIRYQADEDDVLDPPLFELGVEIGIGEAALCPVLKHDDVAMVRTKFGMELSAPTSGCEGLGLVRPNLGWVHMLPPFIVAFLPVMMRYDDDLDTRRSDRSNQLAHIIIAADRFGRLFDSLAKLASFAHEIVLGVDHQQGGAVCGVSGRCHKLFSFVLKQ